MGKNKNGCHAFYGLDVARKLLVFGAFPPGSWGLYCTYVTGVSSAGYSGQLTEGGDQDAWAWVEESRRHWPHFLRTNMGSAKMNEVTREAASMALCKLESGIAGNVGTLGNVPPSLTEYRTPESLRPRAKLRPAKIAEKRERETEEASSGFSEDLVEEVREAQDEAGDEEKPMAKEQGEIKDERKQMIQGPEAKEDETPTTHRREQRGASGTKEGWLARLKHMGWSDEM